MAIEETLLIKLIIDIQQSVKSINNLEKQFAGLKSTIQTTFGIAANDLSNLAKEEAKTAAATAVLNEQIKKQKAAFDATKFPEGSYRQLNAQLKDLNNRYKELSATERNSPIGVALGKNINDVKNKLKGIDAGIGDFQRNVGNYAGSLRGFFKNLSGQLQSTALFGKLPTFPALLGALQKAFTFANQAITAVTEAFSSNARTSRILAESQGELISQYVKEKSQLDSVFSAALNENSTKEEKIAAITQINALYGEYLPNQLTEASNNEQIAAAQKIANDQLIENIVRKQKAVIIEKLLKEAIDAGLEAKRTEAIANKLTTGTFLDYFNAQSLALKVTEGFANKNAQVSKAAAANTKFVEESLRGTIKELDSLGLNLKDAFNPEADGKQASAFDQLSEQKSKLEAEIKQLIITNNDYSKQQAQLRIVTNQLTSAEKEFTDATRFSESELERLSRRKGELETQIKNLALADKDYSKQLLEQQKITAKLAEIDKILSDANKKGENQLESLTSKQKKLNDEIQNAIANGNPYANQLNELIDVTGELNGINKEFADVQAKVAKALQEFAQGSLSDYEQQISDLSKEQKNLNITSQEYADNQAAIVAVEQQRDVILKALAVDLDAVAVAQADLDNQLSDQELQNAAFERAKARIAGVKDATQAGALEIEKIQKDLDSELKAIEGSSLQRKLNSINAEITALESQKQKELSVVGDNQKLKGSIEASYQQKKTDLELQGAVTRGQILQGEVEANKDANAQLLEDDTKTAQQRKDLEMQVADAIAQGAQMVFQIITNLQQQATEKQLATLESERQTQLDRAEAFGASEAVKLRIEKEFDAKKAEVEKKAAERAKAIALGQAAVDIALSILKASASAPPPLNIPAIVLASVLGAIQLAVIASQKFALGDIFDFDIRSNGQLFAAGHSGNGKIGSSTNNHFAKGAYLKNGAYHSEGGMPIINPFSGQKVAEIEKGEAIINRKNTSLFYNELSYINSFKGRGVSFPNAGNIADYEGLKNSLKQKGIAYGLGGTYGQFNPNMLKLQNGAIVAADIARQENGKFANNNIQSQLLQTVINNLNVINRTLIEGFASIPSTAQELQQAAQILKDAENAS